MDLERIKKNIRALLDVGADESLLEGETENALRFARRLMLKHNVGEGDLEEARGADQIQADAESVEYGYANAGTTGAGITGWESSLGYCVCRLFGTVQFYRSGGKHLARSATGAVLFSGVGRQKYTGQFVFYGPADDARAAAELFEEWRVTVAALGRLKFGGALRGEGRSYCEGFTAGIAEMQRKADQEERDLALAQASGSELPAGATRSTALMVTNARAVMTAKREKGGKWLRSTGVHLSGGGRSGGGRHHHGAHAAGRADGRSTSFARNGGTRRLR